ncbi:sensor domain-containing diguanylate cyclase [Baekduia soli]|nr:diguanylate cyclase [Baekduia soli]
MGNPTYRAAGADRGDDLARHPLVDALRGEMLALQRDLERCAGLHRAMARQTPNGFVLLFDGELRHTMADGGALEAYAGPAAQLEGRTPAEALTDELAAELEPRYRAALEGRTLSWECRRGTRTFTMTAGPVRDRAGEIFAGMVSGTDVTQVRHGEAMNMALSQLATAVARNASPSVVFRQLAESLRDLFDVTSTAIARFEGPGRATVLAAAPHQAAELPASVRFADGDERHAALAAVQHSARAALREPGGAPGSYGAALRDEGVVRTAAAPIRVHDRLWGALVLSTTEAGQLPPDTLSGLGDFAELAELAIGNADAWEQLRRDASTDALTGLANHRSFQERLRQEVARADRHGRALSLVLLDIDRFKLVNDTHGHQVGDRVLAEVARRMRVRLQEGELLARIGGEEFAWILPETDGDGALLAAERLRREISGDPIDVAGTITASAGVCDLGAAGSAERLSQLADRALYAAKQLGRDRACHHTAVAGLHPVSHGIAR